MRRESRSIELRKLMPFSDRAGSSKKYRTSDSIHSDEDPLIDEELAVSNTLLFERTIVFTYACCRNLRHWQEHVDPRQRNAGPSNWIAGHSFVHHANKTQGLFLSTPMVSSLERKRIEKLILCCCHRQTKEVHAQYHCQPKVQYHHLYPSGSLWAGMVAWNAESTFKWIWKLNPMLQFVVFFNLYFLLVALSQFVPALKIGNTKHWPWCNSPLL